MRISDWSSDVCSSDLVPPRRVTLPKRGASPMSVIVAKDGPVTIVTIDRSAKRNALDPLTALALREAFAAFAKDGGARVAILNGSSGPFCAGFDLGAAGAGRS